MEQKNAEALEGESEGVEEGSSKCPVTAMKEHLPFVERSEPREGSKRRNTGL